MDTHQALHNAVTGTSFRNYDAIFNGFAEKGVFDVKPRENVFTFAAWKELGRVVKKGEHGVKIVSWIPMTKTNKATGEVSMFRKPKTTTVFHISQTEAISNG